MNASAAGATLIVSGVSLGLGLVAIAWTEHFDRARIATSVLFRRWVTWVAIAGVLSLALAGGSWALAILVAGLTAVAVVELRRLLRLGAEADLPAAVAGVVVIWSLALGSAAVAAVCVGTVLAIALLDLRQTRRALDAALGAAGTAAIAAALAAAVLIAERIDGGAALVAATFFAVALGDVGAYIAGRRLGGPRLAPRVSPAKRWSGLLGNVAGALIAYAVFAALTDGAGTHWWVLAPAVAIASVGGDLLESAVKRHASVKDAGTWLPGFGGLLDRIDSSLTALPLVLVLAPTLGWEVIG